MPQIWKRPPSACVCRSTGGSSDFAANIIDRHISVTQMVYYGFRKRESKNKLRATNIITAPSNLDKHIHRLQPLPNLRHKVVTQDSREQSSKLFLLRYNSSPYDR